MLVPEDVARLLDPQNEGLEARVREALVLQLIREGVISSRKAAELLDVSFDAMLDMMREREVPYFRQSIDDVLADAEVAASLRVDG